MPEMARHIGSALCEVWGLDPKKVGRIVIDLGPGDVATATVQIFTDGEATELLLKLRQIDGHDVRTCDCAECQRWRYEEAGDGEQFDGTGA